MLAAYHVVVYVMIEGQNYLYQQLSTSEDSYCQNYFFSVAIWTQTSLSYHHIHVNTNIGQNTVPEDPVGDKEHLIRIIPFLAVLAGGSFGAPRDIVNVAEGMGHKSLRVSPLIVPVAADVADQPPDLSGMGG